MQSYVINLDRAPERLAHMNSQFNRLGISYTRVHAIDSRDISAGEHESLRAKYLSENGPLYSFGTNYVGVFLSHFKVWEMIAQGKDAVSAVFEDDIHASASLVDIISNINLVTQKFDIIRLETTLQSMRLGLSQGRLLDKFDLLPVHDGAWGAAAYLIKKDVAQWLISSPLRFHGAVDWMLFHRSYAIGRALTVLQLAPSPCIQDQYHPDRKKRMRFSMETLDDPSLRAASIAYIKRFLGPAALLVRRRRRVPFDG